MLFSDPTAFAAAIKHPALARKFQEIRDGFDNPEDINDDPESAPSKRVLGAANSYRKVINGTLAAHAVGIDRMRSECPHFRDWLDRLQAIAQRRIVGYPDKWP